jgi:hypothetical protein
MLGKAMPTDSGHEDSGESNQQSEKTPKGKGFLGILVFLIAVVGVVLIVVSGQDPSIPQIKGYGGNQNPFVGIPNFAIGVLGLFETFMYLITGGILLVVALVVALIINRTGRTSPRALRTEAHIVESDQISYRWTAFYQGYLLLAALSGLIALQWGLTGMAIAKIALFVFAFYSLKIPNETWTRNFHIAINGVAAIMLLVVFTGTYRYFSIQPLNFLLWLPVPNFHIVLPFAGGVVQLLTAALAATWCYFWVQLDRYR